MEKENLQKKVEEFATRAADITGEQEYKTVLDEIRRAKLSVEKYQDELDNLDTKYMDNVESVKAERELKDTVAEAQKRLDELEAQKVKLDTERASSDVKKKESELRDERSKFYTQEKIRLEQEVRKVKHEMEGILIEIGDFKYDYKVEKDSEGNEHKIATNGDVVKSLNEKYEGLKTKLADIQEAMKLCEDKKAEVQQEFEDAVKPINDVISRENHDNDEKDNDGKDNDGKDDDEKDNDGKDDDGKDDDGKDNDGKDDDGKDNDGKDDDGKDDDGKDNDGKDDDGKGKKLPIIDGENEYSKLNLFDKYALKKAAYRLEKGLDDEDTIKWYQKVRLFFPNRKARETAEKYISNGKLEVSEYVTDYEAEEAEYEELESDVDGKDPFHKQDKTPDANKGKTDKEDKGDEEKDNERE